MPDDLLEFVSGPPSYSRLWLWLGIALLVAVVGWFAAIFVATLPAQNLRNTPGCAPPTHGCCDTATPGPQARSPADTVPENSQPNRPALR